MRCQEAQELITGLVDNELSHQERVSIEGHLKDCPKCGYIYGEEQSLKKRVSLAAASVKAPGELRERILSESRHRPAGGAAVPWWETILGPRIASLGPAFSLALVLILVLPVLYLVWPTGRSSIAIAALESHQRILDGKLTFIRNTDQNEVAQRLSRSVAGKFGPMGYDLSAMNLHVVGGVVDEVKGRKILVAIYEGSAPSLTCYTFLGTEDDAPKDATVVYDEEKKISFYTFSRQGVNGVFHREGDLICILVSRMPMKDLLAIARSRAQPA